MCIRDRRVAEHEILQEAQKRAELLERKAEHNATVVYEGAKRYADAIIVDLTRFLGEYQTLIQKNRDELDVRREPDLTVAQPAAAQSKPAATVQAAAKTQPTPARPAVAQAQPKAAPKPVAAPAMTQDFATEAAAVSYTNLDVYKRQQYGCAAVGKHGIVQGETLLFFFSIPRPLQGYVLVIQFAATENSWYNQGN